PGGRVETLATEHEGVPFRFTDDVVVARDGVVYFTDASSRFSVADYKLDILEHGANGRVLAYHPDTRRIERLAHDLHFANGIALTLDETALIVAETSSYRLVRISLEEGSRGEVSVFTDALPGFCDNVRLAPERRVYW